MKPGNNIYFLFFLLFYFFKFLYANDNITSTPLLNIEKIKPSFEDTDVENESIVSNQNLKEKNNLQN